jgi:hypothetical protein
MLYLELTLPCIKVEAKQQCIFQFSQNQQNSSNWVVCVCAVLNLFLLPLVSPFEEFGTHLGDRLVLLGSSNCQQHPCRNGSRN